MVARLLLLLALLLPLPAAAQDSGTSLEGSWALELDGAVIFRFDLEKDRASGEWHGTWRRPESFASDGNRFGQMSLPARVVRSMAGFEDGAAIEVSFNDPRPGAIPDIFRFRLIDPDAAEMLYVGTDLAPYTMQRVADDTPLGPFKDGATYARPVPKQAEPAEKKDDPLDLPSAPPPANPDEFELPPGRAATR